MKTVKKKSTENCHFYSREKSLYIAWACFRNVLESSPKVGRILQSQGQHSYKGPCILIRDLNDSNSQNDPRGL